VIIMGVTISTHNGSIAARDHNIRNEKVVSKEAHIDPDGTHEIWIDIKPRDAYDNLFAAAVKDYNDRQTRDDRKIDDYYNDVCKDKKKHPVYEMIIGVYGKDEKGGDLCSEQTGKDIMHEFVDKWHDRNPNLALIGAYYHADEQGQPHVHLDYIPVAHGYSKGMAAQNGLVKALGEQGFEKQGRATAQIQWEARENKALDDICRSRGLEVDHPREEYRQHMTTEQYKAQAELDRTVGLTKELLDTHDELRAETVKLEAQRDKANTQTQKALYRKARAVKLHKNKDGQGYTYDRTLTTEIKQIVNEVKEDVQEISHTDLDIQTQYEQAEQFRIQREQLLADGKKQKARLIAEGQEYKNNEESYIIGTAESIANEKFEKFKQEFLQGKQTKRLNRLEELCGSIKFKDGTSVLDKFEEQEKELNRSMDREWER
jgi:hypothetical protein